MQRKYFGTDGIRGTYGQEPMTPEFFYRTGVAAADYFQSDQNPLFVIGRDTRVSGPALEKAFSLGVESAGGRCQHIGVVPTAAVAVNTIQHQAAAGVMISASHNPYADNGIKFFNSQGFKLSDDIELAIEKRIDECPAAPVDTETALTFDADTDAVRIYHEAIHASLPSDFSLEGTQLIVDASHGAAYRSTPDFLKSLGADITILNASPDGSNINAACGSQHTTGICEKINELAALKSAASGPLLGLAHDGDADRLIMIDEKGVPLDGDELLAILGVGMLKTKNLAGNSVVATVMSNLGLDRCISDHGGQVIRTEVGDRYVLEAMQQDSLSLGGEQSGHMIFLDYLPTGDGLLSGIQALRFIQQSGQPLYELRNVLKKFPQQLYNLKVREKRPLEQMPQVAEIIRIAETKLADSGRIFFRYSGTENLARLLIEAQDASVIEPIAESILGPLSDLIGA